MKIEVHKETIYVELGFWKGNPIGVEEMVYVYGYGWVKVLRMSEPQPDLEAV